MKSVEIIHNSMWNPLTYSG